MDTSIENQINLRAQAGYLSQICGYILGKQYYNIPSSYIDRELQQNSIMGELQLPTISFVESQFTSLTQILSHNSNNPLILCLCLSQAMEDINNQSQTENPVYDLFVNCLRTALLTGDKHQIYQTAVLSCQDNKQLLSVLDKAIDTPICDYDDVIIQFIQLIFYELINCDDYHQSMINIIKYGQHTDINCCLSGMFLGCVYGYQSIPTNWISIVDTLNSHKVN